MRVRHLRSQEHLKELTVGDDIFSNLYGRYSLQAESLLQEQSIQRSIHILLDILYNKRVPKLNGVLKVLHELWFSLTNCDYLVLKLVELDPFVGLPLRINE